MKKLVLSFVLALMTAPMMAEGNIESPKYEVIETEQTMEIRQYASYFVAQTDYDEGDRASSRKAFQRLFQYISGENTASTDISMTAPVTREDSVKIDMTAPVTMESNGSMKTMSFMIPSKFAEGNIPQPLNRLVRIKKVPSRLVAVNQFSWIATEERKQAKAKDLRSWIEAQSKYEILEGPIYAGYDAPFTLPNLRTHEMMFVVK